MARPLPAPFRMQNFNTNADPVSIWRNIVLYKKELPSFRLICNSTKRIIITCARCVNLKLPKNNGIYQCQCSHVSKNKIVLKTI